MSDTPQHFTTIGAAAPDAVNDHPTLRHEHVTPERVVSADAGERFELHALALDAGATRIAAELERWAVHSHLVESSSAELVELERVAVTSDFAARCNAELRRRADRLLAERRAARMVLEHGRRFAAAVRASDVLVSMDARLRLVPVDTGREHGPIAERVTCRGEHGRLIGSSESGRLSFVLMPRRARGRELPAGVVCEPTHRTRLGWQS